VYQDEKKLDSIKWTPTQEIKEITATIALKSFQNVRRASIRSCKCVESKYANVKDIPNYLGRPSNQRRKVIKYVKQHTKITPRTNEEVKGFDDD
jgi:hypothetical protein